MTAEKIEQIKERSENGKMNELIKVNINEKQEPVYARLIKGDCLAEMDKLIAEGVQVDAIITDPPYGIDLTPQRKTSAFKGTKVLNDKGIDIIKPFLERASKLTDRIYMFASWKELGNIQPIFEEFFTYKNCIVWDKMWFGMGGNWRPNHEFILYGIPKQGKDSGTIPSNSKENILRHRRVTPTKLVHSCEKPVPLIEEIIEQCGEIILDPFMGSGSTGVAAKNTNRKFIGIELDEKYFEIAKERIGI